MYKLFELSKSKEWNELSSFESFDESQRVLKTTATKNTFLFWDGEIPKEKNKQNELIKKIIKANQGRVSFVTIGLKIEVMEISTRTCPGNCFCFVSEGRRCKYYWCHGSGLCWWVDCGVGC